MDSDPRSLFGENAPPYGQHFFCATVDGKDLKSLERIHAILNVQVLYDVQLEQYSNLYPNVEEFRADQYPAHQMTTVKRRGGLELNVYAKNPKYRARRSIIVQRLSRNWT